MRNFYPFRVLSRTFLTTVLTSFLVIGSTDAATAQQHRPISLKSNRSLHSPAPATGNKLVAGSLAGSLTKQAAAATIAQPLTSQHYAADGATWRHETTNTYAYDEAGRITSVVEKHPDGSNLRRETWTYDQYGNETENLHEQWNGSAWELNGGWKSDHTYNANGKITETIERNWRNNAWELYYRYVYSYNGNNQLLTITEYDVDASEWLLEGSYTLAYANATGGPTSLTYMEPNRDGVMVNSERVIDIAWHSFSNSRPGYELFDQPIKSYVSQVWEDGQWVNDEKYDATFGANGSYVGTYQEWENGTWVNDYRETVTYDERGNLVLSEDERRIAGAWVKDYGFKYTYTYNTAGNLAESVQQNYNTGTRAYENTYRIVYSNFQVITSAPLAAAELSTEIYPNPTADKITLSYKQPGSQATLQITDIAGRIVFEKQLPYAVQQQELDLSNFPAGLYMLRLRAGNAVSTTKIMKL
ncbi:T9SS type A sorting domain-containing protein [Pontibacter beigongshangensis]|uniref:T9SS type A sorting domain-containing protein n=1 Tax=Pontibacter beigongshangensis TaxID=2574733 RepID=UPI0016508A8B|nr:T9SS type A sorting domain-containing protein [Pontibacter beigongshangensis]